ncbi:hypothetical protein [Mucilaginibacter sp.]|uniref:hypothetical protein n=1 Tax=Mucilaginibacter sp. TaxID=1882438 RepID=UPI0035BC9675
MLEPDISAINLIKLLEKGDHLYKLITTQKDFAVDCNFKIAPDDNFNLTFTLEPTDQKKGVDLEYFFTRPFVLATNGMAIQVTNSKVIGGKRGLNEVTPCKYEIEVKSFRGDADDSLWKQSSQKAYIKYKKGQFNPYSSGVIFDYTTRGRDDGFYNAIAFAIDKNEFLFYHEDIDNDYGYIIINPKKEIDFDKLRSVVNTVITAYGFLNGNYIMDAVYYIGVKEVKGKRIPIYYYENFNASILSNKAILDSGNYPDIPREQRLLTSKQFDKLINLLFHNEDYLRSAYLLIEAATLTGCSQASLGAVALETITRNIQESNKPGGMIEDKEIKRGLIYKLQKVIKGYSDTLDKDQIRIFSNKIDSINNKPNADKLSSAFDQLSIKLKKEEQDCINSRNRFLHGNLPQNKDTNLSDTELLNILANRLGMLSSMLLLKLAGYNGYVIDRGMTEVIKWRMIMNGEKVNGGNYLRAINEPK